MANKHDILLLFERPTEPVFVPKGRNVTLFDVPRKFLTDRYRSLVDEIENIFGAYADKRIPVRVISLPELHVPLSLGRRGQFSLFIPQHRHIAASLIDIFMKSQTLDDLQSVAVYVRDRVNPYLFNYALSVALLHRADTKGLDIPSLAQVFPNKFVDADVFQQIREEVSVVPEGSRMPIVVPNNHTFSKLQPEHSLWYFREDLGINLHYWNWHLVHPSEATDASMVMKDRRGELFHYMHRQILVRYNVERFCNNLKRVKSFNNFRAPITRGYFPKLNSLMDGRSCPARCDNASVSDVKRVHNDVNVTIAGMELSRDRLYEAIKQGFAVNDNGKRIYLDEQYGIDILGNMVEASLLSPNRTYYDGIYNMAHLLISFCHDPQNLHLESFGVMGDPTTAMRDPVFFEIHAYIDDIFEDHKTRLPAYSQAQLEYEGIIINNVQVAEEEGKANILSTFWQHSDVDFSRGMDFMPRGNSFARFTHLQHGSFTYTIQVTNNTNLPRFGIARIFLAPKHDEKGQPFQLKDQRLIMLELDRFVVTINPGVNTIRRRSTDSSVTIPYERTFQDKNVNDSSADAKTDKSEFNCCACGWPQHMLLPKGSPEGMHFQLFVMISNYADDHVEQQLEGTCIDASSYCGVQDRLYPDRRAMGFPFDRLPRKDVDHLENFLTPNMFIADVVIRHEDRTVLKPVH
ncbi:phenoloxidase 2-like [Calliphora vicina]|uniref:phenoloxidase 2-like n=1 Tax=Calliphora vicina TaxID=7373 RepID=UPI00325AECFD